MSIFRGIKICLSLLGAMIFTTHAIAYTTGPYLNAGAGMITITAPDFFSDDDISASGAVGRLGLGYIGAISSSENPFLLGIEANGNYLRNSRTSMYGADVSGIIGKQLVEQLAIFGKLGGNVVGRADSYGAGPQVGIGVGFQVIPNLRLTGEADYAIDGLASVSTFLVGLQYSFYPTNSDQI